MDVAPVLIGLAGGATVAALMPDIEVPQGTRRVRAMLAGLVGAVGAGYALVPLDPSWAPTA